MLLPTQTADEEQLGGALDQGGFGLFVQNVTVPLLTLQRTGEDELPPCRREWGEDAASGVQT